MSNAPSKPVSFSRPKVGYFSNRPRISVKVTFQSLGRKFSKLDMLCWVEILYYFKEVQNYKFLTELEQTCIKHMV